MATSRHCSHDLLGIEPTSQNLRSLTDAQAEIIYGGSIGTKLAVTIFEARISPTRLRFLRKCWNARQRIFQRVLNGLGAHLVEDGFIGPACVQALGNVDEVAVYRLTSKVESTITKAGRKDFRSFCRVGSTEPTPSRTCSGVC